MLKRRLIWGALGLVALLSAYLVVMLSIWYLYQNMAYPGTKVAGISVSGKTQEEIKSLLDERVAGYLKDNPTLNLFGDEVSASAIDLNFDTESTSQEAISAPNSPFHINYGRDIPIIVDYSEEKVFNIIAEAEEAVRTPVKNAELDYASGKHNYKKGQVGKRVNASETVAIFEENIGRLETEAALAIFEIAPIYSVEGLKKATKELEERGIRGASLLIGKEEVILSKEEVATFVKPENMTRTYAEMAPYNDYFLALSSQSSGGSFSYEKVSGYIATIAARFDTEPQNAELGVSSGKAVITKEAHNGVEIAISESIEAVLLALNEGGTEVELKTELREAEISRKTLASLGLSKLISTGYSNFAGSPANRRHNIRTGASKFNGLLIKPGETFSFTENLGEVDAANGYLPELVIKENTTTPEYGGGLCQVSTTTFRAALNAGLPIVARKAHSYPVSYYRPYGTDATIYVPNPDLKFKNDTGKYILIQTRVVGNYLYFDFYGTRKDISLKFAGNKNATGAVSLVENVTPYTYDFGGRGPGSFKAIFYRFIYNNAGKLIDSESFYSNYDSPDKYPH